MEFQPADLSHRRQPLDPIDLQVRPAVAGDTCQLQRLEVPCIAWKNVSPLIASGARTIEHGLPLRFDYPLADRLVVRRSSASAGPPAKGIAGNIQQTWCSLNSQNVLEFCHFFHALLFVASLGHLAGFGHQSAGLLVTLRAAFADNLLLMR